MRVSLLCLGVLAASAQAPAAELDVPNASFEEAEGTGARGWHWWSRTKAGSAVRASDERHSGANSIRISHDGERDWAFPSDRRFPARPGDSYLASAWVKVKTGHVELAVVALEKGKTLSWDIGSRKSAFTERWRLIEAVVDVPERCDAIYVRFVGDGETLAWVDDVALVTWERPPPVVKPEVQGHARERVRERLDRGIVARPVEGGGVYVGWRLLDDDAAGVAFNVFRRTGRAPARRVNTRPITRTTDFVDRKPPPGEHAYFVRVVRGRRAGRPSREARVVAGDEAGAEAKPYVTIKLDGDHTFQKAGIADLDGDGRYDFVIKQPKSNIDPYEKYWHKSPDTCKLEANRHDGKPLWRHDMGWAIERGIWYSPYIVHDLDGDGRAEVAVKTGAGDPRDADGRVRSGPEYLAILDGQTGKVRTRV
ncbi:MAG: rhamnogalacturonan lyase family protein, partial [Planctomycetota bacterium]